MITKILIIRFSSIGDVVLTTPVIRCLKTQFKGGVELHYLTKIQFAEILTANPYISKIHTIRKNVSEITEILISEKFDYIVDLHNNIRSWQVKKKLKCFSFTFNKLNFKKWLMVNFKINMLPERHIVDRYLEPLTALGIHNDQKGLDYFIPKDDEVDILRIPQSHQNGFVGFIIGARHFTKRMPPVKIISLCKKINLPVVLLGGHEDRELSIKIEDAVGDMIYNACGIYNINQSASLVRQAAKIITHDTGLMHVAAAFKKEIISLWGNTIPEFGMYPYLTGKGNGERGIIAEVKGLSCRPCSKLGFNKCPKGHFKCMNLIDEEFILKAIAEV